MRKSLFIFVALALFVSCKKEPEKQPYGMQIHQVWEYVPAPGQFVNLLPLYEAGDTPQEMNQKALVALQNNQLITLGSFGGYIIFSFDHPIENIPSEMDFSIFGNAFDGNAEPGVVSVSYDANHNNLPDDPWYELAGSEYTHSTHNYTVSYYQPDAEKTPSPINGTPIIDSQYIFWENNFSQSDYMPQLAFHIQTYFPVWINEKKLTFTGTRLPDNAHNNKNGIIILDSFAYGYVDNQPNNHKTGNLFNIEWAVTSDGLPAMLPAAHFIKIHTGVHQHCSILGETSTEISSAKALH